MEWCPLKVQKNWNSVARRPLNTFSCVPDNTWMEENLWYNKLSVSRYVSIKKGAYFVTLLISQTAITWKWVSTLLENGAVLLLSLNLEFPVEIKTRFMLSWRVRDKIGCDYGSCISGLTPKSSNTPGCWLDPFWVHV